MTTTDPDELIDQELPGIVDEALDTAEIRKRLADPRIGMTRDELRARALAQRATICGPADSQLGELVARRAQVAKREPAGPAGSLVERVRTRLHTTNARFYAWLVGTATALFVAAWLYRSTWAVMPLAIGALAILVVVIVFGSETLSWSGTVASSFLAAGALRDWRREVLVSGVLPVLRTAINERLDPWLWSTMTVTEAPGLDRMRDAAFVVATESTRRFTRTVRQIRSGSTGIAGSRGVGKTTTIEDYLARHAHRTTVAVPAPVHYDAREFVLHLHAELCHAVLGRRSAGLPATEGRLLAARFGRYALLTAVGVLLTILFVRVGRTHPSPVFPVLTVIALIAAATALAYALGVGISIMFRFEDALLRPVRWLLEGPALDAVRRAPSLDAVARAHLARIRFLQTRTSGWSGKLTMPLNSEVNLTRSTAFAEQPLTYPEIVGALRDFIKLVVASTDDRPAVIVAIDELDKITDAEQAQRFVNDIKGIFGVDGAQFLVSVSEDALESFERRGLPMRDAFDSAFDEIVRIQTLGLADACELLGKRVIGLTDLFYGLAHCMAGGLARDIIRAARLMRTIGADQDDADIERVCAGLVGSDVERKVHAFQQATGKLGGALDTTEFIRALRGLRARPDSLLDALPALVPLPDPSADPEFTRLRWQAATYVYHCATLLEVFRATLTKDLFAQRRAHLDTLAAAKRELGTHPQVALLMLDEFRSAWGLPNRRDGSGTA